MGSFHRASRLDPMQYRQYLRRMEAIDRLRSYPRKDIALQAPHDSVTVTDSWRLSAFRDYD